MLSAVVIIIIAYFAFMVRYYLSVSPQCYLLDTYTIGVASPEISPSSQHSILAWVLLYAMIRPRANLLYSSIGIEMARYTMLVMLSIYTKARALINN